ncbi:reverse transcriptase domain-containing protein [Tanacetum coccineum]
MRTRSSLEYTIPRRRNRRRSRQQQEAIPIVDTEPEFPMADDRPMAEQLQAPTGGFESAIVVPPINAQNFELKSSLINLVQNQIFRGGNDEEPHAHIRHFESITNNQRYPDVPNTTIKLLLFPFSLDGVAKTWLDKEPPNSILTWDDLVSKFINFFFPPSKTTNLRNEITNFRQIAQESFSPKWERFKGTSKEVSSITAAAVGGFVQGNSGYPPSSVASYIRPPGFTQPNPQASRPNQGHNGNQGYNGTRNVNQTNQANHGANLGLNQQAQAYQAPSTQVPVAYSRFEAYTKANDATLTNLQKNLNDFKREQNEFQNEQRNFQKAMMSFMQNSGNNMGSNHASTLGTLPSNTIPNPRNECKGITTRSGVVLDGPLPPMLLTFLRTARTLIDVFGEEMSLRTDEERLIISVRSEELKYTTRPHKESVCMIDIFSSPKEKDEDPNAIFTSSEVVKCDFLTTNGDPITPPSTIPTKEDLT